VAVVFDAASTGSGTFSGSPDTITFSHSVGSTGTNSIVVVGFTIQTTSGTVDSVKYAGDTATLIGSINTPDGHRQTFLYYVASPTVGSNNVEITASSADTDNLTAVAASYFGVDQNDPVGTEIDDLHYFDPDDFLVIVQSEYLSTAIREEGDLEPLDGIGELQ